MDYLTLVQNLRDDIHRDIVQYCLTKHNGEDGDIILDKPFEFKLTYYTPEDNGVEIVKMIGVDNNGELIGLVDGEERYIYYYELSLEELSHLHNQIVNKKAYSFKKIHLQ